MDLTFDVHKVFFEDFWKDGESYLSYKVDLTKPLNGKNEN